MSNDKRPVLDQVDRNGATWLKLRKHLEDELQRLRERNDNDMSETKTASLRGEIRRIKAVLALAEDKPAPIPAEPIIED